MEPEKTKTSLENEVTSDRSVGWPAGWPAGWPMITMGLLHPGGVEGYQRVTTWLEGRWRGRVKSLFCLKKNCGVEHVSKRAWSIQCLQLPQSLWSDFLYYSGPNQQQVLNSFECTWNHLKSPCLMVILLWSWQNTHLKFWNPLLIHFVWLYKK